MTSVVSKLLLHTCCAPCTIYVHGWLNEQKIAASGFFYNPNIRPQEEYERRLLTMEHYATTVGMKVIFTPSSFLPLEKGENVESAVPCLPAGRGGETRGGGPEPGDCETCYRLRLRKTAVFASENGFSHFSTTLLISPYQDHELLKKLGGIIALETGVDFFYYDWRPGFRAGQAEARALQLYRQKYCGCGKK